jgi:hypothetical protein|tara:strand:+ start:31 stop:531 length:501 start_codon:yes stop_codon:yes gene_type:complete
MQLDLKKIPFIAILMVVAIIILYIGIESNTAIGEDYYFNTTYTESNQSWNASAAGETLNGDYLLTTTVTVTNSSSGENITAAGGENFTLSQKAPNIQFNTSSEYIGQDVNITYQYNNATRGTAWAVTENATLSAGNISKRVPLMATILILAIILGIIFSGIYFQRK